MIKIEAVSRLSSVTQAAVTPKKLLNDQEVAAFLPVAKEVVWRDKQKPHTPKWTDTKIISEFIKYMGKIARNDKNATKDKVINPWVDYFYGNPVVICDEYLEFFTKKFNIE